jgi:hypothetical protein
MWSARPGAARGVIEQQLARYLRSEELRDQVALPRAAEPLAIKVH